MLSLYRCGRQAEALAAYQYARQILVEELGTEPGAELRELHQRILRADPGLAAVAHLGQRTQHLGANTRHGSDANGQRGHVRRLKTVPRQLPAGGSLFAGRRAEISALMSHAYHAVAAPSPEDGSHGQQAAVSAAVIVAIGGTAGVGKTALALHFAHLASGQFPDGQLYLNLRGFDPSAEPVHPDAAVRAFLDALGVAPGQIPAGPDAQAGLYRSLLAGRRMLIVLDNAAATGQVRPLLPGAGGCLVVVTSRRELTGLAAREGAHTLMLDVLSGPEAAELLAGRVGAARLASEPAAAAELVEECARLPLALSIAAARAQARPKFPLAALAAKLRDTRGRLDALDGGEADASVRAVFSWSCQQLPAATSRMFRLLGLHPGPDITAAAAASLAATSPAQAERELGQLAAACLMTEHAPGRYAFHDLLRAYAAEQAAAVDSTNARRAAIGRAADHYLQSARQADHALYPTRPPIGMPAPQPGTRPETFASHVGALAWFDHEHQVLLQVISLAAASALHDYAWRLAWAMETFCYRRAHWRDWESTQRTALAAARHIGDRDAQAHAHRGIANACIESGSYEQARRHLAAALQIRKDTGDLASQARIHLDLARSAGWQRRYSAYLRHARQGLELARRAQHRAGEAFALAEVAWALALTGEHQQALSHCDQALKINEETGYRAMDGHLWNTMGYAYHQLGCRTEAAACYQRAVQIQDEFGFRYDKAVTLTSAGEAYRSLGDAPAARAAWRQALTILHDARHPDAAAVAANLRDLDLDGGVATDSVTNER
jgi:tetratricopeptide (TPR) repeat protein